MQRSLFAASLFAVLLSLGCATPSTPPAKPTPAPRDAVMLPLRVIIKFKDPALDPSTPAFLAQLSADSGEPFTYVRPMSGGAHVFTAERPVVPARKDEILRRLSARPDVAYAQEDRLMQIQ